MCLVYVLNCFQLCLQKYDQCTEVSLHTVPIHSNQDLEIHTNHKRHCSLKK